MKTAVIGAGPAGLAAAEALARRGHEVEVFEEDPRVGVPVHCASVVSVETAERLEARSIVDAVYRELRIVVGAAEVVVKHRGGGALAVHLERPSLEELLYHRALDAGCKFMFNCRVRSAREDGYLVYRSGWGSYDVVLVAEGASWRISRRYGSSERIIGGQVVVRGTYDPMVLYAVFDDLSAKIPAWLVPLDERRALLGCCAEKGSELLPRLRVLASKLKWLGVKDLDERSLTCGFVCLGPPRSMVHGKLVLVGDAAASSKPLSGGGLYAISIIAESLRSGGLSAAIRAYRSVKTTLLKQKLLASLVRRAPRKLLGSAARIIGEVEVDSYDNHWGAAFKAMRAMLR